MSQLQSLRSCASIWSASASNSNRLTNMPGGWACYCASYAPTIVPDVQAQSIDSLIACLDAQVRLSDAPLLFVHPYCKLPLLRSSNGQLEAESVCGRRASVA
jgi:hypothetical protein